MQQHLKGYLEGKHGSLLVTGAYVASDSWDNPLRLDASLLDEEERKADRTFLQESLKIKWRVGQAATGGGMRWVPNAAMRHNGHYDYWSQLNSECYVVESPDAIEPSVPSAYTVMRYEENNLSAAVAYPGSDYRTFVMGVPFETLRDQRTRLMKEITDILLTSH